ncbi:MAG: PEP-CTERM system TPR-repeat protein PrsT [Halioglobus sp.]|nr:PEP-CTERM system TPR-repeat protein PrsT [Halioglobus sp.]
MRAHNNNIEDDELGIDDGYGDWPEPPSYTGLKLFLAFIVLIAVGTGAFLGWRYLVPVDHHARAMEFLAQQNYASTITELKHVIRDNPRDGELRWIMGDTYLQMNQTADATDYMQEAYDLGYRNPDMVLALARSKLLVRDYKGVLKLYEEWSDGDSDISASAWEVLRGWSLLRVGTLQDAVAAFQKALRLNPHNGEAKKGLVESGLGADLAGLSEEDIERALANGLDQPETWILRGELELSRGNMKDARISFEGAVELGPDNIYALSGLVRTLIASNQLDDARQPAALLASKFPSDPMSAYVRALYAKQTQQYVQALDALKVVLDYEPDHAMSILLMGEVYYAMGNQELALEYLNLFHRLAPDSVLGRRQLAAILNERGSPKQAVELLEPLIEQSRRDPEIAAILASAYTAMGDTSRAKGYQSLFFKLGSVTSATRVALDNLNSGATDEAISRLELLAAHAPDKMETQMLLAIAQLRAGDFDQALAASTALMAQWPDDAQVQYLHGSVLDLSGDSVTAGQFYERALELEPGFSLADLALARTQMNSGSELLATQRIEALLARDADNTTAQLWLAQEALEKGDTRGAVARLEKIRSAQKTALQPRLVLADLYLQQGDTDRALAVSREINKLIPDHPVAQYLLANANLQAGNTDESLALLDQLEAANPANLTIKWRMVDAHEANGNPAAAYAALQRLLEIDPDSARALVKLAMMERQRGNRDAVLELADRLIQNHPESGMGYLVKGQMLMDSENYPLASDMLGQAYATHKNSTSLSRYYTALARAGQTANAEQIMAEWLADHPDDNIARLAWADEAVRQGHAERAVEQYEVIARSEPRNIPVLVRLAGSYHDLGDRRDLKTAQEAYELDPEDVYAKHLYGWLLVETGLTDRGTQLLQEVVARAPENVSFRVHLAVALADSGLENEARLVLQPLLDAGIPFADIPGAAALIDRLDGKP